MKEVTMSEAVLLGVWLTLNVAVSGAFAGKAGGDTTRPSSGVNTVQVVVPPAKIEWDAIDFGLEYRFARQPKTEGNIFKDLGVFWNGRQPEQEFERDVVYGSEPLFPQPITLKSPIKTAGYGGLRFEYFTADMTKAMAERRWNDAFWKREILIFVVKFQDLQSTNSFWQKLRSETGKIDIARSFQQDKVEGHYWEFVTPKHAVSMWAKDVWFSFIKVPLVACDNDVEKAIALRDKIRDRIFQYYAGP